MSRQSRTTRNELVIHRVETKSFVLTSEFWVGVVAAAAVLVSGYALDDITETSAWRYATWIAVAYIVSRGIAKAGSEQSYQPPLPGPSTEFWRDRTEADYPNDPFANVTTNGTADQAVHMSWRSEERNKP